MCKTKLNRLLVLIVGLLTMCVTQVWAEDPTVTLTTSSSTSTSSVVVSPVTFSFTNGSTNTSWYSDGLRFYEGAKITVSSESTITKIVFTHGVSNSGCLNLTSGGGSYNASTKTWTGTSKSIEFTVSHSSGTKNGQVKLTQAVVSYAAAGPAVKYTVTLGDNSATLTQATEGANVTLPSRTGNAIWTFAGWSETNNAIETTTAPTIIKAGDYKPTANVTLYPVYTRSEGGGSTTISNDYETAVAPTGWTSNSISRTDGNGIAPHGGSYWGSIAASGTAYIQYNTALTGAVTVTAYVARTTSNTNKGEFKIQTKSGTNSWTDRGTAVDVKSTTVDEWQTLTWTGTLSNEVVRILYTGGTTAVRAIDDVSIVIGTSTTYYISVLPASTYTASVAVGLLNGSILLSKTNGSFAAGPLNDLTASTTFYFQVTPSTGYHIQDGSVKVNGATTGVTKVSSDANGAVYSYTTGSDDMTISAAFDINNYTVTSTLTNVTASPAIPVNVNHGGSISATISANSGYTLPAEITITGGTPSWNASTGALSITNVTGAVSITIEGTAVANFTNNEIIFIHAGSSSAWNDNACVKAWFNNNGSGGTAQQTYWVFNGADYKVFATQVPATGDLDQLTLQRFSSDCNTHWNDNGSVKQSDRGDKTTVLTNGSGTSNVSWHNDLYKVYLHGSTNSWGDALGELTDQMDGTFKYTISNYAATGTDPQFKLQDSYTHWWGSENYTLTGTRLGSVYNIDAMVDFKQNGPSLYMSKTLVSATVSFDKNGHGDANPAAQAGIAAGGKATAPTNPTATGYHVTGWYQNAECTGEAWNFATNTVDESMTLYAKWEANQSTITFNPNGGNWSGSTSAIVKDYTYDGAAVEFPADPVMTGKDFAGWFTASAGGTQVTEVGGTNKPTENVTYFAHWDVHNWEITWSVNGNDSYAEGEPSVKVAHGAKITAMPTDPTEAACDGEKVFVGWTTAEYEESDEAPATLYKAVGDFAAVIGNTTYYAVFATQNGSGSVTSTKSWTKSDLGKLEDVSSYADGPADLTLNGNEWKVAGYGIGSSLLKIGKGAANYLQTPTSTENISSISVTWYANTGYYLTVATTTGTELVAHQSSSNDGNNPQTYMFTGWSGDYKQLRIVSRRATDNTKPNDNALATISAVTVNYGEPTTYSEYATACSDERTVTFNMHGHGDQTPSVRVAIGGKITKPSDPEANGYTFGGWYKDNECTEAWDFENDIVESSMTLHAKWDAKVTTVTLNKNGGANNGSVTLTYNSSTATDYLAAVAKAGYELDGYYTNMTTGDKILNADGTLASGSVDSWLDNGKWIRWNESQLYAHWNLINYSITYNDRNGATNSNPTSYTVTSETIELAAPGNRDGYRFGGWFTEAAGAGTQVTEITTGSTGNKVVYAKWTEITYDDYITGCTSETAITAYGNGGLFDGDADYCATTFTTDETPVICGVPTRENYRFDGFTVTQNGTDYVFTYDGANCEVVDNLAGYVADGKWVYTGTELDLYAHWTKTVLTFTLDKNTGDADGSVTINLNATAATSITNATKTGYTIEGYYATAGTGGKKVLNPDGTIANDLSGWTADGNWIQTDESKVLYAKWTVNKHSVTFNTDGGTAITVMNNVAYGTDVDITGKTTTKTGYTFAGWTVTSGGVTIADGHFTMLDEDVVLTVTWTINQYNVTYHNGDGTTQSEEVAYESNPTMTDIVAKTCSADRVFVGWSETEITTAVQEAPAMVDPTTFSITAAKEFYAVYASKNGGKAGEPASTTENFNSYETSGTYNATPIVCGDWTIVNACVSGISDVTNKMGSNAVVIQKADGAVSSYMQTTNKVDGLKGISCQIATTENSVAYLVQYSTDGTIWAELATSGFHTGIRQKVPVNGTLAECVDAYVRIVLTNATSAGSTYRVYVDDIELTTQTRSYYLTDYATSCEKAASMTLTYDAQGGTEQTAVTEAGWVTLPTAAECERGCYTLTGWLCSATSDVYEPGAKYLFNHDVTMTAQWSVNAGAEVTVTYHTGLEGAETVTVEKVHCGDVLTLVQVPTPEACGQNEFAGWAIGEFANTDNLSNIAQKYAVGTDVVMGDMELHAIWKNGKSDFTKITTDGDPGEGTYILVDPTSSKALSATLAPTPVTIEDNKISTDEAYIQWEVVKTANGYSIHSIDGYLNITADATRAMGLSDAVVDTWNIAESSYNGVYNLGITFGGSDRRVCYNSKHNKWFSYKNRTSGNLYKLTGDGPSVYTMDGFCPHIYHATTIEEMTSGTGVSVLAKENGMIIVENTSVVPVAQKVSGADVFEVTVNPTSTGANGDGSLNYSYSVKFTPTAGNQTYTATYKFIGNGETEDAKHIASEEITFTGYSLPDEFAIVVNRGGQYYALPGGIASAGTPNAVPVTVVAGEVVDLGSSDAYHVHTGAVSGESARTTLRLVTEAGALWATKAAGEATINDYSGDLTSTSAEASTTLTQWTLERYYRESDDEFMGYHLSSDANAAKALFYQSTNGHWGYYNNSYYSGGAYNGEIFFLPISAQFGDLMDIVEWNSSSVVLNMNGYGANTANSVWGVKNASDEMLLSGNRAADRTLEVSTAALVADQYLNIKVYGINKTDASIKILESNQNYKIPHVMTGAQTISSLSDFSASSILYVKSGTTTVNVNLTVAKVVVCPGAELVVASKKTLTTTDLVLRGKIWSYEQPKLTNNGTINATNTYYTRIVADKTEYYPLGLPKSSKVEDVRLSNGQSVTYGETSNWNLRWYDGQQRAERGNNSESDWKNLTSGTIAAKTYYIMGSGSAYYREYYFPINLNESVDNTVAIQAYQGESAPDNGWNGFATPYTNIYANNPEGDPSEFVKVTEKVENNTQWYQHVPDYLYPFFPYFYQTKAAGTLTFGSGLSFEASTPASVAARAKAEADATVSTQWVQLFLENERGEKDETSLYVHPTKFTVDYETGYDVAKMSMTGDRPMVWTKMACGNLAFNAIPDSIAENRIPVGVNAGIGKKMNFTLGTMNYLDRVEAIYLIDETKGSTIDLMDSDYEWEALDGVENRFYLQLVLKHAPQQGTGINQITGGERDKVRKIFYEEKLYIIRNGKMYDATGKAVNKF